MIFRRNKTKSCKFKHLKKNLKPKLEIEIKSHFFPSRLKGISFLLKLQKFPLKQFKLEEKLEIVKWNEQIL